MTIAKSLQDRHAFGDRCFGCGPSNVKGLQIKSYPAGQTSESDVLAEFFPQRHHEAFDGVLNGGIIGTLLDCHSNWTAIWHLMCRDDRRDPPCTVTAEFHVRLRRPTPTNGAIQLSARAVESHGPRVTVEAELSANGNITATCRSVFVEVGPDHPAHHRFENEQAE